MPISRLAATWLSAAAEVFAGVLCLGCLIAFVYALSQRRWIVAAHYLFWTALWGGAVYACGLGVWYFSGKTDDFALSRPAVIAYFFPGLFFLPFLPEPLRRCKRRCLRKRHRHAL